VNLTEDKVTLVSIFYRKDMKQYFVAKPDFPLKPFDRVMVDFNGELKLAKIINPIVKMDVKGWDTLRAEGHGGKILRIANDKDLANVNKLEEKENEAFKICKEKINKLQLPMHLIETIWVESEKMYIFYFTADARVDFRDLVKELVPTFQSKIQLWQVGARDAMKFFGGFGPCGYPLCCNGSLRDIETIELCFARMQNLSLNASKITGACGKLMCCLRYELNQDREEEIEENY